MVPMKIGGDFFKILSLVVQILRLFARTFGDDSDKKAVDESESRSASENADEAC